MQRMAMTGAVALLVVAVGASSAVAKKKPVDKRPPTSPTATGITTSNDPRLVFSAKDNKTSPFDLKYQCSADGAAYKGCTSYGALGLAPGAHTLRVIAIDKAKNKSKPTSVSLNVTPTPTATTIAGTAASGGTPSSFRDVASGGGAVWLGGSDGIRRIDPTSGAVTLHTPGTDLWELAYGHGSIWATRFDPGSLTRIDPVTGQRLATIDLSFPADVETDATGVWVAGRRDGTISRVDPVTNAKVASYVVAPTGGRPGDIELGADGIWVGSSDVRPNLARVSPANGEVTLRVDSGKCGGIALAGSYAVQTCGGESGVAVVDRSTGSVRSVATSCNGEWPLVVGATVWVPCNGGVGGARLLRVGTSSASVVEEVVFAGVSEIGHTTAAFDSVWLSTPAGVLRMPLTALTR